MDGLQADRGTSECAWGAVRAGSSRWKSLFTCQRGLVSLPLGTCAAELSALESCRLPGTDGPASALRGRGISLQPRSAPLPRAPAPALRAPASAGSRARSSQRGSRALQSRFSCGGGLGADGPGDRPAKSIHPPLTPHLTPGSKLQNAAQKDG